VKKHPILCEAELMDCGTLKSSTIFIATSKQTSVYRSVDEVPPKLRKKLAASTSSVNSATILIADRRGRDEVARLIRSLPSGMQAQLRESMGLGTSPLRSLKQSISFLFAGWGGVLISGALGLLAWLFLSDK
jgi:hypothetical protein